MVTFYCLVAAKQEMVRHSSILRQAYAAAVKKSCRFNVTFSYEQAVKG